MVDDHVDRPGVEVRQRMKLTGTNSSIGLIALVFNAHQSDDSLLHSVFRRPGGFSEEPVPDPIPNSAVKRSSADGTSSQDAGE